MSRDNVIAFPGITRLDVPPERVLREAEGAGLESVLVLGFAENGDLYMAASMADGGDLLWLLEWGKRMVLENGEGG